jgi:hypothetical protein
MPELSIPRRLHIDQLKADDALAEFAARLRVFVDGVEQQRVTEYDMDAGTVTHLVANAEGQLQLNKAADAVMTETINGVVTATLKDIETHD